MSTDNTTAVAAHPAAVRRLARAALLAGAIALGATAIGHSAIANAEWDIEKYDACMAKTIRNVDDCCLDSGGVLGKNQGDCYAPAAVIRQGTTGQTTRHPVPPVTVISPGGIANRG